MWFVMWDREFNSWIWLDGFDFVVLLVFDMVSFDLVFFYFIFINY